MIEEFGGDRIVFDLDGTICRHKKLDQSYSTVLPIDGMPELLKELADLGHYIIIHTARNMRTYNGNLSDIKKYQEPVILDWLKKHNITYHELVIGKPWADIYIDDRGLRFTTPEQLRKQLGL